MSNILLHLQDIKKSYGNKLILNDIDLEVSCGEFLSVVGPSGCGKSTLLRLILGQEHVSEGRIFFENQVINSPSIERGIVYQKYGLYPNMTVLDNVILGKKLNQGWFGYFKKNKTIVDEGMEFLSRVGLASSAFKYPHELSGGMQQRVAIAQALIMRPKILMMDEPFGALDPGTRENLQLFLLEEWQKQNQKADAVKKEIEVKAQAANKTYDEYFATLSKADQDKTGKMNVFFVTHDLEEALFLGTRLIVVSQFYTDLGEEQFLENQGAKIVSDYKLRDRNTLISVKEKEKKEFGEMVAQIRREGFDPSYTRSVDKFNLKHEDSFATFYPRKK